MVSFLVFVPTECRERGQVPVSARRTGKEDAALEMGSSWDASATAGRSPLFYTFSTFLLQSPVLTFPPTESLPRPPPPYVSDSINHSHTPLISSLSIYLLSLFSTGGHCWSVSGTNMELFEGRQGVERPRMTLTPSPGPALSKHSLTAAD